MGRFRSSLLGVCAGTLTLVTMSCDSGGGSGPVPVGQVQVSPGTSTIEVGQTTQLTASVKDEGGNALTGRTVSWSSGNPSVATVSAGGLVTGVSEGVATITATSEGISGSASVTVTPESVSTVEVAPAQLDIILGQAGQLTATPRGASGTALTGRSVAWESSDNGVATVDANGMVTSVALGTTTITATSEGISGTATVNVLPVPVETVEVLPAELSVAVGVTGQLAATTKAADGTVLVGRTVAWTTSDGGIATVDATGLVTGVAVGVATITATSEGKSGTATVTVVPAAFEPLVDTTLEGDVSFGSVTIPAGVTVTITDDLDLDVDGDISIAGTITADCVEVDVSGGGAVTINGDVDNDCAVLPPGGGPPLTIIGNGTFDIDGSSMASSGEVKLLNDPGIVGPPVPSPQGSPAQRNQNLNGPFPCTLMNYTISVGVTSANTGTDATPDGNPGFPGTGFIFGCNGDLSLKGNVQIETQEGGKGGKGTHNSNTNAKATGGDGGDGGGLFLWAFGDFSATMEVTGTEIKNHLFSGRGGDAGDAEATAVENDGVDPAPSAEAIGGFGGAAGVIEIQTAGDFSVEPNVLYVGPGQSNPSGGTPGGGAGGDAKATGARGKNADERTPPRMAQVGGTATAEGGWGGDAPGFETIILGNQTGFEDVVVEAGDAGPGGEGHAIGGKGGDGIEAFPDGAAGGNINAEGGWGGDAFSSRGGAGGRALFEGGMGGTGWSDCQVQPFTPGGDGGKGGDSTGGGGPGGAGLNPGADGSHDTKDVSNGGNGGNGAGPGSGGAAGANAITDPFVGGPDGGGGAPGPERAELGSGSFIPGNDGMGCNAGGNFDTNISVQSDPAGHHFFIGMPGQMFIFVGAIVINPDSGEFFMSGIFPFVTVSGTWNPETGAVTASGVGTVAGVPNTVVTFTGTLINGVLSGTYQMGAAGLPPGSGGLPGGIPIFYAFSGTLVGGGGNP